MPHLTTHVLDTANGRPAAGVEIDLHRLLPQGKRLLVRRAATGADGRTGEPLMAGEAFEPGDYELTFHVGAYFRAGGAGGDEPPFLDAVPVRVHLADGSDYHVPLLVSPWGYTTYRGS